MRRYVTLTLLAAFFIWLPNAFADSQMELSIDAPSQVRHVQGEGEGGVLLTLRVNNIQVQASWQVSNAVDAFAITNGKLSLSVKDEPGVFLATVYVVDEFSRLNSAYANLTASAVISVEILSGGFTLSPVPTRYAIEGRAESLHTLVASEAEATYEIVSGNDDNYFTLGVDNGILSLLATAPVGGYTLSIVASDGSNQAGVGVVVSVVSSLSLSAVPRVTVVVGDVVHTLSASGGIGDKTYILLAGNADYFSINTDSGVLSVWSSATVGIYTLSVEVRDEVNSKDEAQAVVQVVSSLSLLVVPRLVAVDGEDGYLYTLAADGGIGAKTYTLIAGNKDYFVLLDDRVLSVSAVAGLYTLTLGVADSRHNTAQVLVTVGISAMLMLSDAPPLTVIASVAMSLHTFMANGGIGDKTYTLVLDEDSYFTVHETRGVLSLSVGVPVGLYTVTVQAIDADNRMVIGLATVGVSAALSLAAARPISVVFGATMSIHTFVGMGGIGRKTYTLLAGKDAHYFNLGDVNGVLSLTGSAPVGFYTLSVRAIDTQNNGVQFLATVLVLSFYLAPPPKLYVIEGRAEVLHTFMAGGVGENIYTVVSGNEDYFSIGMTTGVLSVSSATVGVYTLSVEVRDGNNNKDGTSVVVEVVSSLSLSAVPLLTAAAGGTVHLHTLAASGGIEDKTYTLLAGNAEYFVVAMTSGVLSLSSRVQQGVYTLTLGVADSRNNTAQVLATVEISAALELMDAPPVTVIASVAMSLHMFIASGGIGQKTYTLAFGDGNYFGVDAASGVLSLSVGTPARVYTLSVVVLDTHQNRVAALATVAISAALVLMDAPPVTVIASVAMSLHTFIANGGIGVKTYTLISSQDDYFAVNATTGVLSLSVGIAVGLYTLTVRAIDMRNNAVDALATVDISATLTLADAPLLAQAQGKTVTLHQFVASGGIGHKTYTIVAGEKDYFNLNVTSGVLSSQGDAPVANYTLSVHVSDSRGHVAQALATVAVLSLHLNNAPKLYAVAGRAESLHTFVAEGGDEDKNYMLIAGREDYFSIGMTTGILSVQASITVGLYTVSVQVSDKDSQVMASAVVEVVLPLSLADVSLVVAKRNVSVGVELSILSAIGGIKAKTYTLVSGGDGALGIGANGVLSVVADIDVGQYSLVVEVWDSGLPPNRVSATVHVRVVRNEMMVLGGDSNGLKNDVWSSWSGESWFLDKGNSQTVAWLPRKNHQAVAHGARLYILGGDDGGLSNDVWSSVDGKNWVLERSAAKWETRERHQAVSHGGLLYVLGGHDGSYRNDVWSSSDGEDWTEETTAQDKWSGREGHQAVSYNGRLYVLGGYDSSNYFNDVWSSVDGKDWTQETDAAAWTTRYLHQALSHQGRLYVLGGNDGSSLLNDVWSSTDGKNWTPEKADDENVGWSGRFYHQSLSHRGRLYVMGGNDGGELNDVWSSVAGGTWELVDTNGPRWSARDGHQAVVFPPSLLLDGVGARLNVIVGFSAAELHTLVARYGDGKYSYSLQPPQSGFMVNNGTLSFDHDSVAAGDYTLTVRVSDGEGSDAQTAIRVRVEPIVLGDVEITIVDGHTASVYTFMAVGGEAAKTYTIVAGNDNGHFALDEASGVLSVLAGVSVTVYTLAVEVSDGVDVATANAVVSVASSLSWSEVSLLFALTGVAKDFYTVVADGGIGAKTYDLAAEADYFTLSPNGVLSVSSSVTVGLYTLSVSVVDSRDYRAAGEITVEIRPDLSLLVPLLFAITEEAGVYTLLVSGGFGDKSYTLVAGSDEFRVDDGVLSWSENLSVRVYTLSLVVGDDSGRVTVSAVVDVVSSLSLAESLLVAVGRLSAGATVYQLSASGGVLAKTYTLVSGSDGYLGLDAASGVLSVANDEIVLKPHSLVVAVQDSDLPPNRVTATVHVVRNKMVVLGGYDGGEILNDVWSSWLGQYWFLDKPHSAGDAWPPRQLYQVVAHGARLYVLGGNDGNYRNDVWSSVDGRHWVLEETSEPKWKARDGHQAVSHGGRLYVLGGNDFSYLNDVWSSVDGKDWSLEKDDKNNDRWSPRVGHQVVSHNGRLYVLGGHGGNNDQYLNDVWSLVDGKNWSLETNAAAWPIRAHHQALSYRGSLYVLGGSGDNDQYLNDVWSSPDGKNWSPVKDNNSVGWAKRRSHQVLSHRGSIYVMGGHAPSGLNLTLYNDVWSSADGVTWREVAQDGPRWSPRNYHQAVMFPPSLLLDGVGERLRAIVERTTQLHEFAAHYGGGNYTYSLSPQGIGFNLNNGLLSADENAELGSYTLTVRVADGDGSEAQTAVRVDVVMVVLANAPALTVIASVAMSLHTFVAEGGEDEKTYTVAAGDARYFTVNATSGVLSVLSSATVGLYTLSVVASHDSGQVTAVAVVEVVSSLSWSPIPVLTVAVGGRAEVQMYAHGGIAAKTYSLVARATEYLVIASDGVLSVQDGIALGRYTVSVQVRDGRDYRADAVVTMEIKPALFLAAAPLLLVMTGRADQIYTMTASGGFGAKTYTLVTGNTEYFVLATNGVLSVQASITVGLYSLLLAVGDESGHVDIAVTVSIWQSLLLPPVPLLVAITGRAENIYTLTASGGIDARTYTLVAGQRDYFALATDGVLSVASTAAVGNYTLTAAAVDSYDYHAYATITVDVRALLSLREVPLLMAISGVARAVYQLTAEGGVGARTYSLVAGQRDYFVVATNGVLSVQASVMVRKYTLSVAVIDDYYRASTAITVDISLALSLAVIPSYFVVVAGGEQELYTFAAGGGIGPKTYMIVAGDDNKFFILGETSGVLSVVATVALNDYDLQVVVQDSAKPPNQITAVVQVRVVNSQMFLMGGENPTEDGVHNDVWSSGDGITWNLEKVQNIWPARGYHQVAVHNKRMYVAGGENSATVLVSDVWSSDDGQTWNLETANPGWSARKNHQMVSHHGRLYIAGGYDINGNLRNDVWSFDGQTWGLEKTHNPNVGWTPRENHQMVSHHGRLYLAGGNDGNLRNDVWSSVDGKHWTQEKAAAQWSARTRHGMVSYNLSLYVMGGNDGNLLRDVWSSPDGKNWKIVKNTALWSAREGLQVVVYDNSMYIVGADDQNDVFRSTNGADWGEVNLRAPWLNLRGRQAVVFPPALQLAGVGEIINVLANVQTPAYTMTAQYGAGNYTYSLTPSRDGFEIGPTDGVLKVVDANLAVDDYRLTVQVQDGADKKAKTIVRVRLYVPPLEVAAIPPLAALARGQVPVILHTFTASGGFGAITYDLMAGNEQGYFAFDAANGELSLPVNPNRLAGQYTLSLRVATNSGVLPVRATVGVMVRLDKHRFMLVGGNENYDDAGKYLNDIWSSTMGKTWWRENPESDSLRYRYAHQMLWHQGTIYVLGGRVATGRGHAYPGPANDIWSSLDGINWQQVKAGERWGQRRRHQAVSYHGRIYVLGGQTGLSSVANDVWLSFDGKSWERVPGQADWSTRRDHQAVVHRGRIYVLGGRNQYHSSRNDVWSSRDGENWDYVGEMPEGGRWGHQAVSHQGRLYVLGGARSHNDDDSLYDVWSSVDGSDWVLETSGAWNWKGRSFFQALSHEGRIYVLGGLNDNFGKNDVWSSEDGKVWRREKADNTPGWSRRGQFQAIVSPPSLVLMDVAKTLVVYSDTQGSVDPRVAEFQTRVHTFSAQHGLGDYTYSLLPKSGFAVSSDGHLSADGTAALGNHTLTVQVEDSEGSQAQTRVEVRVEEAALSAPLVLSSGPEEDPYVHQIRPAVNQALHGFSATGGGNRSYSLVGGNELGYFGYMNSQLYLLKNDEMVAGEYNVVLQVKDSGSKPPQILRVTTRVLLVDDEIFVLGGGAGGLLYNDVWSSAGKTWAEVTTTGIWSGRRSHQVVIHQDKFYLLGGATSNSNFLQEVWSSTNGKDWQPEDNVPWPKREGYQAVSHHGKLYVAGGHAGFDVRLNDVWSLDNNGTWTRDKLDDPTTGWTPRNNHQMVSHNGRLYVMGGQYKYFVGSQGKHGFLSDVWSSRDGEHWIRETADAGWPARDRFQAVAHQGRIYVLGGRASNSLVNDVWSSADGKNWSQEKANNNVGWTKRQLHQAVARDDLIYVLGGNDDSLRDDVWSSRDGKTWTPEHSAGWLGRQEFQAVVYPPALLLQGVGATLSVAVGASAANLHTFVTEYGSGSKTYSLSPAVAGFAVSDDGRLSATGSAAVGHYVLTVWVEDTGGSPPAQTRVEVEVY